jgi:hypothetical protein
MPEGGEWRKTLVGRQVVDAGVSKDLAGGVHDSRDWRHWPHRE